MGNYITFNQEFPLLKKKLTAATFSYRYHKHPTSETTLVLLVGGLGLSDLIFSHFQGFSKDFSVLIFDYPEECTTNNELVDGIYELLTFLGVTPWFVGQSLGGFVAQLIAEKYPEITSGLVLSNTGTVGETLSPEGTDSLLKMIENSEKSKKLLKKIPFPIFLKLIRFKILHRHGKHFPPKEKEILKDCLDIMDKQLTRSFEFHMIDLLIDFQQHLGIKREKFLFLQEKTLLILSDDDETFHTEVKNALISLMPSPTVHTTLTGGHLALMVNCEEYISLITDFISKKSI